MSDTHSHADLIRGLREFADFLESRPTAPTPYFSTINAFVGSKADLADAARAMAPCQKSHYDKWIYVRRVFGPFSYDVNLAKQESCEGKVVGVRHVPEVVTPARDEEIVEWDCAPILAIEEPTS